MFANAKGCCTTQAHVERGKGGLIKWPTSRNLFPPSILFMCIVVTVSIRADNGSMSKDITKRSTFVENFAKGKDNIIQASM